MDVYMYTCICAEHDIEDRPIDSPGLRQLCIHVWYMSLKLKNIGRTSNPGVEMEFNMSLEWLFSFYDGGSDGSRGLGVSTEQPVVSNVSVFHGENRVQSAYNQ
jgi:hypothetical protein